MTAAEAVAFIREHGIVLAAAKGPVPRLAAAIVGGPIRGSWWAYAKGKEIFRVFGALAASPDVLTCRLVGGKSPMYIVGCGRHRSGPTRAFRSNTWRRRARSMRPRVIMSARTSRPKWVPAEVIAESKRLSEAAALEMLGDIIAERRGAS